MKDYNLSILGTVNKRRRFLPSNFTNIKGRDINSSLFGCSNDVTLVSFVPKKDKVEILLSTMHYDKRDDSESQKPIIIMDYIVNKGGVDNFDKLVTEYSTRRRTHRWPLAFYHNILDIAALATYIIYTENNPEFKTSTSSRRVFLQQLSEQLIYREIERRS